MPTIEVRVPAIGDFKDVGVVDVLVKPGDAVAHDQSLVTLESDKATMDVPSPAAGTVREVKMKAGDRVKEGSLIVLLEASVAAGRDPGRDPDGDSDRDRRAADRDQPTAPADRDPDRRPRPRPRPPTPTATATATAATASPAGTVHASPRSAASPGSWASTWPRVAGHRAARPDPPRGRPGAS